jgi:TetR/AcrR family transcriptional regulator, cholesterol catabolism regulator
VDRQKGPEPVDRRERRKQATRQRIFDCAAAQFAARGYEAVTFDDIAECADVARATVFNHFSRKDEFVAEWLTGLRAGIADILATESLGTGERVRSAFQALAQQYEKAPRVGRAMVEAWLRSGGPLQPEASATADLLTATLRRGQQAGDVPSTVDATVAGRLLLDAYLGTLSRWARDDDSAPSLATALSDMLDLALDGIVLRSNR